jgi:hypothetical protein
VRKFFVYGHWQLGAGAAEVERQVASIQRHFQRLKMVMALVADTKQQQVL